MKVGDSIKLKNGIVDPDTGIKLDGFIGRIKEYLASNLVNIEWDSISLQDLPDTYIRSAINEGCDYLTYNIEPKDLELCQARDSPADVIKTIKLLGEKWDKVEIFGDDAALIEEIEEEGWWNYLQHNLKFPFKCRLIESNGSLKKGMLIDVLKLSEENGLRGIIIKGKKSKRTIQCPLANLEVVNRSDLGNLFYVDLYRVYFWNQ